MYLICYDITSNKKEEKQLKYCVIIGDEFNIAFLNAKSRENSLKCCMQGYLICQKG